MKIISIGHRSGHGKDTFANYMVEYFQCYVPELKVVKWSWAWKLKLLCYDLYKHHEGCYPPEYYDTAEGREFRNCVIPSLGMTIVELWIKMGEGIRHQVYENTWAEWSRYNVDCDILITADTRKHTETAVSDITIKVVNPRIPNRVGASIDGELQDYPWQHVIVNDMGYYELRSKAYTLCFDLLPSLKQYMSGYDKLKIINES